MRKFLKSLFFVFIAVVVIFSLWLFSDNGEKEVYQTPENTITDFHYSLLNDNEKIAYELITKNIYSFPETIAIPKLSEDELLNVYEAVLHDDEEISFLKDSCSLKIAGKVCLFVPDYYMSREEFEKQKAEIEKVRDEIIIKSSALPNDYQKEKFVHDYIINNCKYVEKTGEDYSYIYGCLIKGEASCEGYSRSTMYLLKSLGIESRFVFGEVEKNGKNTGHAWNTVKLDEEWYHLDVTWDDTDKFISYTYFNLSDDSMMMSRKIDEEYRGFCLTDKMNYFRVNKVYFSSYSEDDFHRLTDYLLRQVETSNDYFSVSFDSENSFTDWKNHLVTNQEIYKVIDNVNLLSRKRIKTNSMIFYQDDKNFVLTFKIDYE